MSPSRTGVSGDTGWGVKAPPGVHLRRSLRAGCRSSVDRPLEVVLVTKFDLFMADFNGQFIGDYDRRVSGSADHPGINPGRRWGDSGPRSTHFEVDLPRNRPQTALNCPDRPPPGCEVVPRTTRLGVRCTPEAAAWVRGLADHCSLDVTSLVWQSLLRQAEASGYYTRVPQRYRARVNKPRPPSVI